MNQYDIVKPMISLTDALIVAFFLFVMLFMVVLA